MSSARFLDLYLQACKHRSDILALADEKVLAILAGESARIFGQRVEFTLSWPDGLPLNFTEETALREWATEQLAEMRERRRAA